MSNLVISRICNLSCPYCFAGDLMQVTGQEDHRPFIKTADFMSRLAFLKRSGIQDLRLIGGEPSLHPQFCELLELGLQAGFHILVFTHGLLPASVLEYLERLSETECTLLVNMNAQGRDRRSTSRIHQRRLATMQRLRHLAAPGFNIYTPDFDLISVIEAIQQTGCRPVVRLGLAHPTLKGNNTYLHPKQYPFVGGKIASFVRTAKEQGIHFEFDCGFVRCMFWDEELATLKQAGANIQFECSPILDLDLDNRACHCFPLAGKFSVQFDPCASASELRDRLIDETRLYRMAGVYPTCSTCEYKARSECSGGCLTATMRRFRLANIKTHQQHGFTSNWKGESHEKPQQANTPR